MEWQRSTRNGHWGSRAASISPGRLQGETYCGAQTPTVSFRGSINFAENIRSTRCLLPLATLTESWRDAERRISPRA